MQTVLGLNTDFICSLRGSSNGRSVYKTLINSHSRLAPSPRPTKVQLRPTKRSRRRDAQNRRSSPGVQTWTQWTALSEAGLPPRSVPMTRDRIPWPSVRADPADNKLENIFESSLTSRINPVYKILVRIRTKNRQTTCREYVLCM